MAIRSSQRELPCSSELTKHNGRVFKSDNRVFNVNKSLLEESAKRRLLGTSSRCSNQDTANLVVLVRGDLPAPQRGQSAAELTYPFVI